MLTLYWTTGCHRGRVISWPADWGCEEGLGSVQVVTMGQSCKLMVVMYLRKESSTQKTLTLLPGTKLEVTRYTEISFPTCCGFVSHGNILTVISSFLKTFTQYSADIHFHRLTRFNPSCFIKLIIYLTKWPFGIYSSGFHMQTREVAISCFMMQSVPTIMRCESSLKRRVVELVKATLLLQVFVNLCILLKSSWL
jgi:hypothetical protein